MNNYINKGITTKYRPYEGDAVLKEGFGLCILIVRTHNYSPLMNAYCKDYFKSARYYVPYKLQEGKKDAYKVKANRSNQWYRNLDDAVKAINNSEFFVSEGDYDKYVTIPNKKNDYGLSYGELLKLGLEYKSGNAKRQYLIEQRLHDINFHTYATLLSSEDYRLFCNTIKVEIKQYDFPPLTEKEMELLKKLGE